MAKRKQIKKIVKEDSCDIEKCNCKEIMIRLGAMALILFLITVWSGLGKALLSVPWWVYLIIWILFCGAAMGMKNNCFCCKK